MYLFYSLTSVQWEGVWWVLGCRVDTTTGWHQLQSPSMGHQWVYGHQAVWSPSNGDPGVGGASQMATGCATKWHCPTPLALCGYDRAFYSFWLPGACVDMVYFQLCSSWVCLGYSLPFWSSWDRPLKCCGPLTLNCSRLATASIVLGH